MSDKEKKELKETAEQFLKESKNQKDFEAFAKEKGYTASTKTFDAKETSPAEELIKAADTLKEGEFTDVVETATGYYVAKVTSLFDKDATEAKKESIVNERQNKKFTELTEKFVKDAKIEVDKKAMEKNKLCKTESNCETGRTGTE